MRGIAESMAWIRPRSAREALERLAERPEALPLAGGTDFMVAWNAGLQNHRTILDLSRVAEWGSIHATKAGVIVGALATHSTLQRHPAIRRDFPLLPKACALIGALAIQNRGTLGGNIANASPAGDTFPPLAVYEAIVHVASREGRRAVPFTDIFAGVKKTTLRPGELITAVELPFPRTRPKRSYFRKVGTRAAQALSKTVAAGLLWLSSGGAVEELRFALGSMAPTVRRLKSAESFLRGKRLDGPAIDHACTLLERDVSPIDDVRSTAEYRLAVSRNLLREFLENQR